MAPNIRSISGVALAALVSSLLAACGGGGGGGGTTPPVTNPPPVAPPAADTKAPTLMSVSIADGATGVSVALSARVYTFDEDVVCRGQVTLESEGHAVPSTTACSGKTLTFTPAASTQAFWGEKYALRLPVGAVADAAGNPLALADTRSFTTEFLPGAGATLYVANGRGNISSLGIPGSATLIDAASQAVKQRVMFAPAPGHFGADHADADAGTGRILFGSNLGTFVIHQTRVTGEVLPSIVIDPANPNLHHGVRGLAHSPRARCAAFGELGYLNDGSTNYWQGAMKCWKRDSDQVVFTASAGFLADRTTEIVTKLLYHEGRDVYYVVVAKMSTLLDIQSSTLGGYRLGFAAGQSGRVIEVDAKAYTVRRSWTVGSASTDALRIGDKLYVTNAGDKSLSVVDLSAANTGVAVTTHDLRSSFLDPYENPMSIASDGTYLYVGDYLTSVRVLSLAGAPVGRVDLGNEPGRMTVSGGLLWVTAYAIDFRRGMGAANAVYVIDLASRLVVKTIMGAGDRPAEITVF